MGLIPETVVEDRGSWSLAVNLNQDLLGKTMLVLNRPGTAVIEVQPREWAALNDEPPRCTCMSSRAMPVPGSGRA
jgi:hypothetical protein